MSAITLEISPTTYRKLSKHAETVGKKSEELGRELLEAALQSLDSARPKSVREILQARGRIRPLGETLQRKIIPGVTLDSVRKAFNKAEGPALSDIVLAQRGPKI